ncbi:E3 ubiquitin-protein ligase NRDP1 [Paramecium bursaria]
MITIEQKQQSLKDYVIDPNNDYKCGICFELLNKPKKCGQCQHYFCSDCLDRWLANFPKNKCPFRCDNNQNFIDAPKEYQQEIRKLRYNCPNIQIGCKMIAQYSIIMKHIDVCGNQQSLCLTCKSNQDCISINLYDNHHVICLNCINSISEFKERLQAQQDKYLKEISDLLQELTNTQKQHKLYIMTHQIQVSNELQLQQKIDQQKEQEVKYQNLIQEQLIFIESIKQSLDKQQKINQDLKKLVKQQQQTEMLSNGYYFNVPKQETQNKLKQNSNYFHYCQNFNYKQQSTGVKCNFCVNTMNLSNKYQCLNCQKILCQKCL